MGRWAARCSQGVPQCPFGSLLDALLEHAAHSFPPLLQRGHGGHWRSTEIDAHLVLITMLRNVSKVFRTWPAQAWASELLKRQHLSLRTLPANMPSFQDFIQSKTAEVHVSRAAEDANARRVYIETYGCQMNGNDTGASSVLCRLRHMPQTAREMAFMEGCAASCRDPFGNSEAAWVCQNA